MPFGFLYSWTASFGGQLGNYELTGQTQTAIVRIGRISGASKKGVFGGIDSGMSPLHSYGPF